MGKEMKEEWRIRAEKVLDKVSKTPGERGAILYFAGDVSEYMKKHVPRELTHQTLTFLLACIQAQKPKPETEDTKQYAAHPEEDGRPDKEHINGGETE